MELFNNKCFGCCPDGFTKKIDFKGSNCKNINYGFCNDNKTLKEDIKGTNCDEIIKNYNSVFKNNNINKSNQTNQSN
jgi:hypothetical protein